MGAEPLTALAGAKQEDLTSLLRQLISEQRETNRLLKNEFKQWLSGDEAAALLGKKITKSGEHKRVLAFCRKHGHLTIFGQSRPYTYWHEEVRDLQRKVAAGQVFLP